MREPRSRSSEVSVPASPSEALTSLREAVEQLRRLDFENVEEEGRPEAKKSLQQFAQGLHLVREYHPAELQAGQKMEREREREPPSCLPLSSAASRKSTGCCRNIPSFAF